MIQSETQLLVSDNSGANYVKCIRVINSNNKAIGLIGSLILTRVIKKNHSKKIKKKSLYFGLIIMTKQYISRMDGTLLKFSDNRIILFNKNHKFLDTRIYGPITKEIYFSLNKSIKLKQTYLQTITYADKII